MVRLISEEHIDYIRYAHQVVCMGIVVNLLRDSSECPCISDIVRILDDDFLACDVTLLTQSEETYEEESVGIRNVRYRLQHMVGGKLTIDSVPGEGTKVTITIPTEEAKK